MKLRVYVQFKEGVFDPQGNTLAESLRGLGYRGVTGARVGKVIELEMDSTSMEQARRDAQKMAEQLLANPVIETYKIESIS